MNATENRYIEYCNACVKGTSIPHPEDEETLSILYALYRKDDTSYMIYDVYETKSNLLKEFTLAGFYNLIQHLHFTNILKWDQFMDSYSWVSNNLFVNGELKLETFSLMNRLYKNNSFRCVDEKNRMKTVLKKCREEQLTIGGWKNIKQKRRTSKGEITLKYAMKSCGEEITIGKIAMVFVNVDKTYKFVQV